MKLKKKQFTKLQQIAFTVNQILPGTGIQLDKLISDIESVQKPKEEFGLIDTDQLKKDFRSGSPFYESLTEEGKNAVENSLSASTKTVGLLDFIEKQYETIPPEEQRKSYLSDYLNRTGAWSAENTVTYNVTVPKNRKYKGTGEKLNGIMDMETGHDPAPQIGDIGYFWDERYPNFLYTGILSETKIDGSGKVVYYGLKNKNISKDAALFGHFSKTPPELK